MMLKYLGVLTFLFHLYSLLALVSVRQASKSKQLYDWHIIKLLINLRNFSSCLQTGFSKIKIWVVPEYKWGYEDWTKMKIKTTLKAWTNKQDKTKQIRPHYPSELIAKCSTII